MIIYTIVTLQLVLLFTIALLLFIALAIAFTVVGLWLLGKLYDALEAIWEAVSKKQEKVWQAKSNSDSEKEMTNQASELYELCKEVYEKTGWKAGDWYYERTDPKSTVPLKALGRAEVGFSVDKHDHLCPLYTSDYLLENLPVYSDDGEGMLTVTTRQGVERNGWMAYYEDVDGYSVSHEGIGKSPLLALLKLTIALSEAGELK